MSRERRFPSEEADRVMIRLPDGMRDELKRLAEEHGCSVTHEIVERLQRTLMLDRKVRELRGQPSVGAIMEAAQAIDVYAGQIVKAVEGLRAVGLEGVFEQAPPSYDVALQAMPSEIREWIALYETIDDTRRMAVRALLSG